MSAVAFATFWHGDLNPTIRACLATFPAKGAKLTLYAYDEIDPPQGVALADARDIVPDVSLLSRYLVGGKPSLATFSDRFRYDMIRATGLCWVDADMICLRPLEAWDEEPVWGQQPEAFGKALINNAVLRLPANSPVLDEMIRLSQEAVDRDLSWGAIGPFLLTEIAEKHGVYATAKPPSAFYPVGPDEFWQMLLPHERAHVAEAVRGADFLHLWSELFRRAGYDFRRAPPPGSYLAERLGPDGFAAAYSPDEVEALLRSGRQS